MYPFCPSASFGHTHRVAYCLHALFNRPILPAWRRLLMVLYSRLDINSPNSNIPHRIHQMVEDFHRSYDFSVGILEGLSHQPWSIILPWPAAHFTRTPSHLPCLHRLIVVACGLEAIVSPDTISVNAIFRDVQVELLASSHSFMPGQCFRLPGFPPCQPGFRDTYSTFCT